MNLFKSSPGLQAEPSAIEIIPEKRLLTILKKLFGPVVFLAIAGLLATPVTLRCTRLEQGGPVNCVKQASIWGIIPLRKEGIDDVRGALVSESVDYEGDTGYRVELLTAAGTVPLRNIYISDFSGKAVKDEFSSQINRFVRSRQPGTLAVTEPGLLSLDNVYCFLIWLLLTTAGYVWKEVKSAFGRVTVPWTE